MINNVTVFTGSKKDFDLFLKKNIDDTDITIPFLELIQHYNARLRPNESGVGEDELYDHLSVTNCVVRADDYSSVLEHVLLNFTNVIILNYDIENLYLHNPPRRVLQSIARDPRLNVKFEQTEYKCISIDLLKNIYSNLCSDILGQETCKKSIVSGIYRLSKNKVDNKPAVLLLYGPSGVGKTESAKSISKSMGGELLRIQFSMMQTVEAYNYIFGDTHNRGSFARDLLNRETNVVLIDEFDKVNKSLYNAFYEAFDEGRYSDTNYDVNLQNTIFLCTSNFKSENEIKETLGPAMFSRIGCCIEYLELTDQEKEIVIKNYYNAVLCSLDDNEKEIINNTDILEWFIENNKRFDNIRLMKSKIENAIFDRLTDELIIEEKYQNHKNDTD